MTDIVAMQISARRLLFRLACRLPVLPVFAPGRGQNQHRQQNQHPAAQRNIQKGDAKLQAIYVVFVETGRTVEHVIAPQRRTDTRVQFRTSESPQPKKCNILSRKTA